MGVRRVLGGLAEFVSVIVGILLFPVLLARARTSTLVQAVILIGVGSVVLVMVLFPPLALLAALLLFVLGGTVGAMTVQQRQVDSVERKDD
ncbi:hypothetical protein [Haloarchaeobius sp. DT45]|uniref:hypothetical protein n=1 Tax=Haloarchaeobius sp. DT45 TaxID=3446116 RepID=UPI003F6D8C09